MPLGCGAADAGLAAYFPLDEGAGTQVLDCSGNGLSGTIHPDGGWGTREGKPALSLESTTVSLGAPDPLKIEGALTLAAFVWIGALEPSERPAIVSKMGSTLRGWELAITNQERGRLGVLRISPDNEEELAVFTAQPLPFGQWIHLAATFSPGVTMRIYVDGKLSSENPSVALGLKDTTAQAVIGGRSYAYPWRGLIDDVRIYSRALSEAEIAAIARPR